MKKILVLKGLPASGKSTYAKQLVKDKPGMYKRINRDDLRHMLDGYHFTNSNEKFIKKTRDWLVQQALHAGKHVIIDDTNLAEANVIRMEQLALEHEKETGHKVMVDVKTFDISVEEAIERDSKRENPVGKEAIKRMHRQHFKKERKTIPIYRTQNPDLDKAIICDLDGTLALITNRSPFDGSKCEGDLPNTPVVNMVKQYKTLGYKILLLSGRQGQYQPETERWLAAHNIEYDALWMRAPKDNRKDSFIKRELFENHIEDQYYVEFVLDDRDQVVDLWRQELHLPCLQVFYGDF